jgi:hypothetical protein
VVSTSAESHGTSAVDVRIDHGGLQWRRVASHGQVCSSITVGYSEPRQTTVISSSATPRLLSVASRNQRPTGRRFCGRTGAPSACYRALSIAR